ncbi:zinc finger, CCHC-type containing protein [Tanacetum coccineum]
MSISSNNIKMHNDIMVVGSKEHPPMLALGIDYLHPVLVQQPTTIKEDYFMIINGCYCVVYVLTTTILEDVENVTVDQIRRRNELSDSLEAMYMAEDASSKKFLVINFTNYKMTDSRSELLDFKHTFKHNTKELTLVDLGSHLRIEESLRMQDSDKPKGNNVVGPLVVNMVKHNNSFKYNDNKGRRVSNKANGSGINGSVNDSSNSLKGAIGHVCKDRCWFKTYESLNDRSILHMGNESTTLEQFDFKLNIVNDKIGLAFMSTSKLDDSILWHAILGHVHFKRMTKSRVLGEVIRLPDPKLKILGKRGIECIFVGYAKHSNAFRFYVIKHNESVLINSIIESRDVILDDNRFPSFLRPSQTSMKNGTEDIGGSVVPKEVFDQYTYCFNVEDDPNTFDEAMKSQDVAFLKEEINDEMDSILDNNTWMLADLPPGCKPLGWKWILKRKLKVDGTIEKFKARLFIKDFRQKSRIYYFDTYALVVRISTIRLMAAMASIHNLIIHQVDVKIAFLNGELDEEVYMNQPHGFIMLGNENKVDMTKEFLSSRFSMIDMGEVDVIFGIRIKHESNGIANSQSHYIKKVLKKFNYFDCTPVSTPMDTSEKLMPNNGQAISQLEYSRDTLMQAGSAILNNSSTSAWVFLLSGGPISLASTKQTCITSSTIEYEFVAFATAGKEVESAATLAKACRHMYNGKSRHLGNDLLTDTHGSDLYTIALRKSSLPTLICFMAKASPTQAWLWHRRLSHLNFETINLLSKNDIVNGLPKLKCVKDQLCSSCEMGKAKRSNFKTKTVPSSKGRLHLLHMDLCGSMRVESINGKKYILVIIDDYSRYNWTHFMISKDETPEVLIDFLKMIQRGL